PNYALGQWIGPTRGVDAQPFRHIIAVRAIVRRGAATAETDHPATEAVSPAHRRTNLLVEGQIKRFARLGCRLNMLCFDDPTVELADLFDVLAVALIAIAGHFSASAVGFRGTRDENNLPARRSADLLSRRVG